jgi:hypothetical protein
MEEHIKNCSKIPCAYGFAGCTFRGVYTEVQVWLVNEPVSGTDNRLVGVVTGSQAEIAEHAEKDCALKPIGSFISLVESHWKRQNETIEALHRENAYG